MKTDIAESVEHVIHAELNGIEEKYDVKILYACESGSRAWGFESQDSDYDVRFIYVRKPDWYLSLDVEKKRDVIELPIVDELDINGWDIRKALNLLRKSNPALLEWLKSPIVYRKNHEMELAMSEAIATYFSPRAVFYHYLHMAKGNFREYLQRSEVRMKKYFYVLRPVLCMHWIEQRETLPPIRFDELVEALIPESTLKEAIGRLLVHKKTGLEADLTDAIPVIHEFLDREIARLESVATRLPQNVSEATRLDDLFREIVKSERF